MLSFGKDLYICEALYMPCFVPWSSVGLPAILPRTNISSSNSSSIPKPQRQLQFYFNTPFLKSVLKQKRNGRHARQLLSSIWEEKAALWLPPSARKESRSLSTPPPSGGEGHPSSEAGKREAKALRSQVRDEFGWPYLCHRNVFGEERLQLYEISSHTFCSCQGVFSSLQPVDIHPMPHDGRTEMMGCTLALHSFLLPKNHAFHFSKGKREKG